MNRVLFFSIIPLFFFPLFLSAADFDNQLWLTTSVSKSLPAFKISAAYEWRYGHDVSDIVLERTSIAVFKKFTPHWAVEFAYKKLNLYKVGVKTAWDVPYANIYYYWNWGALKLDNRSRLEYLANPEKDNYFRFRNKLRCKSSNSIFGGITPYMADEIFYDFNDVGFKWNRNYFGITKKMSPVLGLDLFYCLQSIQAEPEWVFYNAGGVSISAAF